MEKTKTSPGTWKKSLDLSIQQRRAELGSVPRLAVVGVGNALRRDDAAGMLVAGALSQQTYDADHLLILEAGLSPENRTAELRNFCPSLVLFIDAAEMGEEPGTVQCISEEEIDGMSASTHSLPLSIVARYLSLELDCKVMFLGIQPASNEVGEGVCSAVLQAVHEVATALNELIRMRMLSVL